MVIYKLNYLGELLSVLVPAAIFIGLFTFRNLLELVFQPAFHRRSVEKKGKISLFIMILGHIVSGFAVCWFLYEGTHFKSVLFVAGLVIFASGFAGRVVSLRKLGTSYNQFIECHPDTGLVTTGIYSFIRHPLYMFYLIELVGLLIAVPNMVSLLCLLGVLAAVVFRINAEDLKLSSTYGQEFADYKRRTRRLIPFLY